MMNYENKRKRAIELNKLQLQQAEQEELETKNVHRGKKLEKPDSFYSRLNFDAERRKQDHIRSLQMKNIREEEEMRQMFKPKINQGVPQSIYSTFNKT